LERDPARKRELHNRLTALLPHWFGRPQSNAKYAIEAEILDGYIVESEGVNRGLLLLKYHGALSAEVYWMGVDPTCHRRGMGRALLQAAVDAARDGGARYLIVATLHPNDPYEPFVRTRRFYEAMDFVFVHEEHFPVDPEAPLAYYLKQL